MSLLPAISSRGRMRFGPKEPGGGGGSVFIEFLKRLLAGASHVISPVAGRGAARIARTTRAFAERLNGSPRLFYLPPYSPDRNPGELVWKHLKTDTAGRIAMTRKDAFKAKVRSSLRQLQTNPEKIRTFHQKPSLRSAAPMSSDL